MKLHHWLVTSLVFITLTACEPNPITSLEWPEAPKPLLWDYQDRLPIVATSGPTLEDEMRAHLVEGQDSEVWTTILDVFDQHDTIRLYDSIREPQEHYGIRDLIHDGWPSDPEVSDRAHEFLQELWPAWQQLRPLLRRDSLPNPGGLSHPVLFENRLSQYLTIPLIEATRRLSRDEISAALNLLQDTHRFSTLMSEWPTEPQRIPRHLMRLWLRAKTLDVAEAIARHPGTDEEISESLDSMLQVWCGPITSLEDFIESESEQLVAWLADENSQRERMSSLSDEGLLEFLQTQRAWLEEEGQRLGTPPLNPTEEEWLAYGRWRRHLHSQALEDIAGYRAEVARVAAAAKANLHHLLNEPWLYDPDWNPATITSDPLILQDAAWHIPEPATRITQSRIRATLLRALIVLRQNQIAEARNIIDLYSGEPLLITEEHIRSFGPDRVDQGGATIYDPTNGIVSAGDQIITLSGGSRN